MSPQDEEERRRRAAATGPGHGHASPAAPAGAQPDDADAVATFYTCPMHPQVRQPQPGSCPLCGMTLEPVLPSLDDEENPELADFQRRFRWVDTLLVDKTGTLTEGKPAYHAAVAVAGRSEEDVLRIAASIDQGSEHPLAHAIVAEARRRGLALAAPTAFESSSGIGVRGVVAGQHIVAGNMALMDIEGIDWRPLAARAEAWRLEGATIVCVAADRQRVGLVAVSDPVKNTTAEALALLRDDGIIVVMATGDGVTTARSVAARLGIAEVHGEVTPQDKLTLVEQLQAQGHTVAMAGDGINDSPALAKADVGIAMGTGTDIAIHSAHITLVKGDLRGIARARSLSRETVRNMRQNLAFAFLYNALGIPIAAGLLFPLTGDLLSPMIAALAMSLSSVSVIGNALRLRSASAAAAKAA